MAQKTDRGFEQRTASTSKQTRGETASSCSVSVVWEVCTISERSERKSSKAARSSQPSRGGYLHPHHATERSKRHKVNPATFTSMSFSMDTKARPGALAFCTDNISDFGDSRFSAFFHVYCYYDQIHCRYAAVRTRYTVIEK